MPGPDPMATASRSSSSRKAPFLVLQVLVAVTGILFVVQAAIEFLAAASGDPTPLFVSTVLVLLATALFYTSVALRSRESTPFFTTLVVSLFGLLVVASLGGTNPTHYAGMAVAVAVIAALALLRERFHLRPGEVVKEEKLPPEVAARISTKVRGIRCRECGDDDVWLTSDKLLVCKNCGTTNA